MPPRGRYPSDPRTDLDELDPGKRSITPIQMEATDLGRILTEHTVLRNAVAELRTRMDTYERAKEDAMAAELEAARDKVAAWEADDRKRKREEAEAAAAEKKRQDDQAKQDERDRAKERRQIYASIMLLVLGTLAGALATWLLKR
jgi:hypothetical protein